MPKADESTLAVTGGQPVDYLNDNIGAKGHREN
jgi:hypothetical protein